VVLAAATAFALSKHEVKKYTATAALRFNNQQLSQQVSGVQPINSADPQAQQDTNVLLVQLGNLPVRTAAALGHGITGADIKGSVTVSAQGDTSIVNVAATSTSPTMAAKIANTYCEQFITEQTTNNQQYVASALRTVEKQIAALPPSQKTGPAGLALQTRAQSLAVLGQLQADNVGLAQQANVPTAPSSPNAAKNTLLGAVFGLLVGFGLAFLLDRLDRNIREPTELQQIYGQPLLGVVSESSSLSGGLSLSQGAPPANSDAEAFRMIRAHLRYLNISRELRTLMVTSAAAEEGKTTVAAHLAATAADMGTRVLLLEADLRRPTLSGALSIAPRAGLADVLIGTTTLEEAVVSPEYPVAAPLRDDARRLEVLVAGAVPANPGELIESPAMEMLLKQARSTYDLVIIDTPPIGAVSDAIPLLRRVDGVIVVGRMGRTRRDVTARFSDTLNSLHAPILGVVANGLRNGGSGSSSYLHDYYASYPVSEAPKVALSPTDDHSS
jgi:polysaccharide biosynthesis transport protein